MVLGEKGRVSGNQQKPPRFRPPSPPAALRPLCPPTMRSGFRVSRGESKVTARVLGGFWACRDRMNSLSPRRAVGARGEWGQS